LPNITNKVGVFKGNDNRPGLLTSYDATMAADIASIEVLDDLLSTQAVEEDPEEEIEAVRGMENPYTEGQLAIMNENDKIFAYREAFGKPHA
jgi:hypothetical protein